MQSVGTEKQHTVSVLLDWTKQNNINEPFFSHFVGSKKVDLIFYHELKQSRRALKAHTHNVIL